MFIHSKIEVKTAIKYNSDAAHVIVYIPPNATTDYNIASLCVWIVPNTVEET